MRRGSTRASPFYSRIFVRVLCMAGCVSGPKVSYKLPGNEVPFCALSGIVQKLSEVNGSDHSLYWRWLSLQRGLIPMSGIFRKLSEVNGIFRDFGRLQTPVPQRFAANYPLCSTGPRPFPGSLCLPGLRRPVGASWCWWPLWALCERGGHASGSPSR
jgi:hypothetical protein